MKSREKIILSIVAFFLFAFFALGFSLFFHKGQVAGIFKEQAKVKPTMTLFLGKETVDGEEKIKIYGTTTPAKAGIKVTLSKKAGKKKKYRNFARPQTNASGEYSQYITPDSSIKSIQAKAKVSKKNLTRKSAFDLNSIPDIDTGEDDSGALPACGTQTEFFSAYPIGLSYTTNIAPLGNVNPSGHVFPTDHIYFYIVKQEPGNPVSPPVETPLYSPGNVRVTSIDVSEHLSESPPYSDYTLTFYACDNIYFKYSHITTLAQKFLDQLVPPYASDNTYETGGKTYHMYNKTVSMDLTAGEEIGTAGGRLGQNALDFYAYDICQRVALV